MSTFTSYRFHRALDSLFLSGECKPVVQKLLRPEALSESWPSGFCDKLLILGSDILSSIQDLCPVIIIQLIHRLAPLLCLVVLCIGPRPIKTYHHLFYEKSLFWSSRCDNDRVPWSLNVVANLLSDYHSLTGDIPCVNMELLYTQAQAMRTPLLQFNLSHSPSQQCLISLESTGNCKYLIGCLYSWRKTLRKESCWTASSELDMIYIVPGLVIVAGCSWLCNFLLHIFNNRANVNAELTSKRFVFLL